MVNLVSLAGLSKEKDQFRNDVIVDVFLGSKSGTRITNVSKYVGMGSSSFWDPSSPSLPTPNLNTGLTC